MQTSKIKFRQSIVIILSLVCFTVFQANAQSVFYWTGAGSNTAWSNNQNWLEDADGGGAPQATANVPSPLTDVVFDAAYMVNNSVAIVSGDICNSLTASANVSLNIAYANSLVIYGDLILSDQAIAGGQGTFELNGSGTQVINLGTISRSNLNLQLKNIGIRQVVSDLDVGFITLTGGAFIAKNKNIQCRRFSISGADGDIAKTLNIENSNITLSNLHPDKNAWLVGSSNVTFTSTGSVITIDAATAGVGVGNLTYNELVLGNPAKTGGVVNIGGNATINKTTFNTNGYFADGGTNTFTNLILTAGKKYEMAYYISGVVIDNLTANGVCGAPISWLGQNKTITINNIVSADYFEVYNLKVDGTANFAAIPNVASLNDITFTGTDVAKYGSWVFSPNASKNYRWQNAGVNNLWSNSANWVNVASGSSDGCIPDYNDVVVFDATSFPGGNNQVEMDLSAASIGSMTWNDNITANPVFTNPLTEKLFINGSLKFTSNMTMSYGGEIYFSGDNTHTIDMAGKAFDNRVYFIGGGTYTLESDFSVGNASIKNQIYFNNGTLNTNTAGNYSITAYQFSSGSYDYPRNLYLNNSHVYVRNWSVYGGEANLPAKLTIYPGNSTIHVVSMNASGSLTRRLDYHDVILENYSPADLTGYSNFNNITSTVELAKISGQNIINGTAHFQHSGELNGSQEFNHLIVTKGKTYTFTNATSQKITGTFSALGDCSNPITFQSTGTAEIDFQSSTINVDYLQISQVNATNTANTDIVVNNGQNLSGSTGWAFAAATTRTLYWVGGTGNWGDKDHWSLTSGGTFGECIPTPFDNVIFDNNSFSAAGQVVTLDQSVASVRDITWANTVTNQPDWAGVAGNQLTIYGSLHLPSQTLMTSSFESKLIFRARTENGGFTPSTIDIADQILESRFVEFEDVNGVWNLQSDFRLSTAFRANTIIGLYAGELNVNTHTISAFYLWLSEKTVSEPKKLDITNSQVELAGVINGFLRTLIIAPSNVTLVTTGSTITFTSDGAAMSPRNHTYNIVHFKGSGSIIENENSLINELIFDGGGNLTGKGTINKATFNGPGAFTNLAAPILYPVDKYTIGDLIFTPGNDYTFQVKSGSPVSVTNSWIVAGFPCKRIILRSTATGQQASIETVPNVAIVDGEYLNIQDIAVTGSATYYAGNFSQSAFDPAKNNTGWTQGNSTNTNNSNGGLVTGLGDDLLLKAGEFPRCLDATLAFPQLANQNISVNYQWQKDGVDIVAPGGTASAYCVTEAGTYNVVVTYTYNGDECVVNDEIVITLDDSCPYQIGNATFSCVGDTVCVWLKAKTNVTAGIIGMDYCLQYDASVVEPITDLNLPKDRRYEFGEVVTTNGQGFEDVYINYEAGQNRVYSSIFYRDAQNATNPRYFTGSGNVICIKFRLKTAVTGQFPITACQVSESYALGEEDKCADPGMVEVTPDVNKLKARIIYWNQEGGIRPLAYDNSGNHLITNIHGNVATCDTLSATTVNTDANGYFVYDKTQGSHVTIKRDIPGDYNGQTGTAPDMMNVVNGMDCYYAGLITTFDQNNTGNGNSNWTPNAFQMLAADVNMNDKVRANDITLIQNRIVLKMQEYPQVWNYAYTAGNTGQQPTQAGVYSLDWRFVDQTTVNTAVDFNATNNYPVYVGNTASDAGFWRDNAPDLTTCRPVQEGSVCDTGNTNNLFYGIMLGDVDGSWITGVSNHLRTTKSEGTLAIDLFNSEDMGDGGYRIPVYYRGEGKLHAIDFSFEYDHRKVQVQKADYATAGTNAEMKMRWNAYQNQKFLLTSYTMKGVNTQDKVYYIEVKTTDGDLDASAFQNVKAYLNGKASQSRVIATAAQQNAFAMANNTTVVTMYPNPASNVVTLSYSHISQGTPQVVLSDLNGQKVNIQPTVDQSGKIQFGVSHIVRGLYLVTLYDGAGGVISRQKLMIKR
ncbi:hypothetical protein M23134_02146 [Microscilla marina ATCC 23134]|uniref:Secretion system C-terminal sorting domain-containing protein n=2 Tax=Microscilla marina TaxID=1027 RepID=A1ZNC5_MICM2|nr:hypothetical protein M23134_02146 [Microscilla marina ATCC 23134]